MNQRLIIKNLFLSAGLIIASLAMEFIFAQEIPSSVPANVPVQQNDTTQFQTWLKDNGEAPSKEGPPPPLPSQSTSQNNADQPNSSQSSQSLVIVPSKEAAGKEPHI